MCHKCLDMIPSKSYYSLPWMDSTIKCLSLRKQSYLVLLKSKNLAILGKDASQKAHNLHI